MSLAVGVPHQGSTPRIYVHICAQLRYVGFMEHYATNC